MWWELTDGGIVGRVKYYHHSIPVLNTLLLLQTTRTNEGNAANHREAHDAEPLAQVVHGHLQRGLALLHRLHFRHLIDVCV